MIKTIKSFPKYKIDELGNIYGIRFDKPLKSGRGAHGYQVVVLMHVNGTHTTKHVHRLVLEAFVGSCPKGFCACHNNGNKQDNRLCNLRWDSYSNNHLDKRKHGTDSCGVKNGRAKLTEQDVRMIIYMWNTKLFTQYEIANIYDINHTNVWFIVNKKSWKHIWSK